MRIVLIFIMLTIDLMAGEENFSEKIQRLNKISPEDYSNQVDEFNSAYEKFVERKSYSCQSEISTFEKRKCVERVNEIRVNYLNAIFMARKNYLNHLHNRRLQELEEERQNILKSLN